MAPEQARGKKVDRRADIWAFGVVVYEMLTGERLFQGEDTVQVLSKVLEQKVDLDRVPAKFRKLLARCLDRNPKDRLRDIGEARFLLSEPVAAAESLTGSPTRSRLIFVPWAVAVISVVALGLLAMIHFREQLPELPKPVRFQFTPENVTIVSANRFALSPDGTKLAYYAAGSGGLGLWVRSMDALESRPLSTTDVRPAIPIFWSYDSRFVLFQSAGKLKKIDVSGGSAQSLCDVGVAGVVLGGSSNREGTILFGSSNGPLLRVSSEGGTAVPVTTLDPARGEVAHLGPVFLPDGRHFLYMRRGKPEFTGIYLGSLDAKPEQQTSKRLLATDLIVEFVPMSDGNSGQILFLREGTLLAQPLDLHRLGLTGQAVPVAEQVTRYFSQAQFSSSRTGTLVYRSGGTPEFFKLTWFDRQGKTLGTPTDAFYGPYTLTLSPDGSQAAAEHIDVPTLNIWLVNLIRGGRTRLTYTRSAIDRYIAWSPDGSKIAFSSNRAGHADLYQHAANGAGEDELLLKSDSDKSVEDWSRDGRFLLFSQGNANNVGDLWVLPMDSQGDRKPIPYLRSEFESRGARFSPDDRWIAHRSNESGTPEIYVRPFPAPPGGGGKWIVSQGGGQQPRWRSDGKELFYLRLDGELMAVEVSSSGTAFQPGIPKPLFKTSIGQEVALAPVGWDVSADGTKFLFPIAGADNMQYPFTVVLHWTSLLEK
jgi:Tol biopolymer transport system component